METIDAYLGRLASAAPTPGGGSAAGLTGALAAALLAMVARITIGAERLREQHRAAETIAGQADDLRARFLAAGERDEQAYAAVIAAQQLPRVTDEQKRARREALDAALQGAAAEPLAAARLAVETIELAGRTFDLRNTALASDVGCGVELALASLRANALNVRINHRYMPPGSHLDEQAEALIVCEQRARRLAEPLLEAVAALVSPPRQA